MEPAPTPRVLLADDDKSILERTCAILCEFEVVGMVRYGRDAIAEVQRLDPDMLVIDISMPILYGLQAASQLQSICCRTKVVFLTVHEDKDFVAAAFSVGASGYVAKSQMSADLVPAIREVLQGGTFVSQSVQRVTSLALSITRWDLISTMATAPEAPYNAGQRDFPGPVKS